MNRLLKIDHCLPMAILLDFLAMVVITLATSDSVGFTMLVNPETSVVELVRNWLNSQTGNDDKFAEQPFAQQELNRDQADEISRLIWNDRFQRLKIERKDEWHDRVIQLADLKMKFEYRTFGEKPDNGRSLYISLHGGGDTATRVNDQQWNNQIGLYQPEEGIYLAPRAPNDAWNMWHQSHIDAFFSRIIQDAILFEHVNSNRVYLMGYSAGGDGVYQLAPRMADSLAAAAMMAGHPNDASPLGLRNIGFTIHVGGMDRSIARIERS